MSICVYMHHALFGAKSTATADLEKNMSSHTVFAGVYTYMYTRWHNAAPVATSSLYQRKSVFIHGVDRLADIASLSGRPLN